MKNKFYNLFIFFVLTALAGCNEKESREATSHSTMPNKKDNGQLQTTTKKIQYN